METRARKSGDAFFTEADPATFLVTGDAAKYTARTRTPRTAEPLPAWARAVRPREPPKDAPPPYPGPTDLAVDGDSFEAMWGIPMPGELRAYQDLLRAGAPPLYEWRPVLHLFGAPECDDFNVVEWMIHRHQRVAPWLGTELFAGLVLVGSSYGGNTYHYGLFDRQRGASDGRVWHFDHDIDAIDGAIADNLSTLLYTSAVLEAHREARTVSPRAAWLERLLRDDGRAIGTVKHVFLKDENGVVPDAAHAKRIEAVTWKVPSAMYALFRAFFFDEGPRLRDYVSAAKRSRARIIRDAGRLAEELAEGRKQLGTIRNVQALREELRTLDLDPAQAASHPMRRQTPE